MRILLLFLIILPISLGAKETQQSSITLKRSACYGLCPTYSMTVFSDGVYFWVGEENVAAKGYFYGKFSPSVFERAMQLLNDAKYLKFKDRYFLASDGCKQIATDNPTVSIEIQIASTLKKILHYQGCREFSGEDELLKLEKQIDEIFETDKWISRQWQS